MNGAQYFVSFRRAGYQDLGPIPVQITPRAPRDESDQHTLMYDYEVSWDDDYGFTKDTTGAPVPFQRIDSVTFILWSELSKPIQLNHPNRRPHMRWASAMFTVRQS